MCPPLKVKSSSITTDLDPPPFYYSPYPFPLVTIILLVVSEFQFYVPYMSEIPQFLAFSDWFISLSTVLSRTIHNAGKGTISSFLWVSCIPWCTRTTSSLPTHLWKGCRLFVCLGHHNSTAMSIQVPISLQKNVFNLGGGKYSDEGLLGPAVTLFLNIWGPSILFSIVAVPVCVPTSSEWGFPLLHNFSNTCYYLSCR